MHLQAIYNQLDAKSDLQHILILKKALLREQSYIDWLDFCLVKFNHTKTLSLPYAV